MFYIDYDATYEFSVQYRRLLVRQQDAKDRPRLRSNINEQLHLLFELFATFTNHTLANKYPGKKINPLYSNHAQCLLEAITSHDTMRRMNPEINLSRSVTITTLMDLLEAQIHDDVVAVTVREINEAKPIDVI